VLPLLIFNVLKLTATDTHYLNVLEIMNNITDYRAVGLAEGFEEGTKEEIIEAWQHLHDTGLAYTLQGWFGRAAVKLNRTRSNK
jgi:Leu/Phe-tRNA-protein transferase